MHLLSFKNLWIEVAFWHDVVLTFALSIGREHPTELSMYLARQPDTSGFIISKEHLFVIWFNVFQ